MFFEKALVDGVPFLRALPRARQFEEEAWTQLAAFRAAHPEVSIDLVVDRPPGRPDIDFDLLVHADPEGTVALGWRPDAGMPWTVLYSEHWAANLVLTVNGLDVTIQDALQVLRLNGEGASDLSTRLVDHCLIAAAILKDPPTVSDQELQSAADTFRLARGLHNAEATGRWLAAAGLSHERFEALLKAIVQARKLKERINDEQVSAYFVSHAESLAIVTIVRVCSASEGCLLDANLSAATIGQVIDRALSGGSIDDGPGSRICIETGFLPMVLPWVPPESDTPPAGTVLGPERHREEYCWALVLRRLPAQLNRETRGFIQERLFASWLEGERGKAEIRWHWM